MNLGAFACGFGKENEFVPRRTERPKHANRTRISSCCGSSCCDRKLPQIFPLFPGVSVLHMLVAVISSWRSVATPLLQPETVLQAHWAEAVSSVAVATC